MFLRLICVAICALALSLPAFGAPGNSPASGLVSYWSFDNTTADGAGTFSNNVGTVSDDLTAQGGAERYVTGQVGSAIAVGVDAADATYLNAPDSADVQLAPIYTIESWIYPTDLSGPWQRFVLRWACGGTLSYHFAIRELGGAETVSLFHWEADGAAPNANGGNVVVNEWQHIAGVADGSMLRVYLNGVEVDAVPYDGTMDTSAGQDLGIAESACADGNFFYNGYIDEVAIWNVALTADELLSHYQAGADGYGLTDPSANPDSGLVSFYDFEGNVSDTAAVYDESSSTVDDNLTGQNGTLRYAPGQVGQALAIGETVDDVVYLNAPDSADIRLPATYTIEAWINPSDLSGPWQRLVLRWGCGAALSYHFAIRDFGGAQTVSLFHAQLAGLPNANGGNVVAGEWQHIAGVADGAMLRVYLNGQQVDAVPYDGTIIADPGQNLGVGESACADGGLAYNGLIDELAMWSVALTPEQIEAHYLAGAEGYGLSSDCTEDFDSASISGADFASVGGSAELTAAMDGVDDGAAASFAWEIIEGTGSLSNDSGATTEVSSGEIGAVVVQVSAADGVCDDNATATFSVDFLPADGPGASPAAGLVCYYNFEPETSTNDASPQYTNNVGVSGDNLTPRAGALTFAPGLVGQAVQIGEEGSSRWLDAPSSADIALGPQYTIECWVYPTELADSWQRIVLRWGGNTSLHNYHFAIRNNTGFINGVSLFHNQADFVQPNANGGTVQLRRWQHLAGVADGTMIRVYLNGEEVAAVPYDGTVHDPADEGLGLGDAFGGPSPIQYNGLLDEVALWNVALSPDQIRSHYRAGADGYGLTEGCFEDFDDVSISGATVAGAGDTVTLTAEMMGVDAGGTASFNWEVVEGDATTGPTDGATLDVTGNSVGAVIVRVSAGDGVCDDTATAEHSISFLPAGNPGLVPAAGLVSYWDFDESTADHASLFSANVGVADDNLAPLGGSTRFGQGVVGNALAIGAAAGDATSLDGVNSPDVDLPGTYTIECWVFPTELSDQWQRLVLRWGGGGLSYHFAIRNNGVNSEGAANINAVSLFHQQADGTQLNANGGTVVLNEWQHIAAVADGLFLRVYLNGQETNAVAYDGTVTSGTTEGLGIADGFGGLSGLKFNGFIDELAMWNVALSPEQLESHYLAGVNGLGFDQVHQLAGDCRQDGNLDVSDVVCYLQSLFPGFVLVGPATPPLPCAGDSTAPGNVAVLDVNGDGNIDISEPIFLANYLFSGGPPPAQGLSCFVPAGIGCENNPDC